MLNFKKFLFCISLFFICQKSLGIYGGLAIEQNILSSVVNIKLQNGMCSGTVISPNVILTAAHCKDMSGDPEFVVIYNPDGPTRPCDISNVVDMTYFPEAEALLPLNVHAPDILLLKIESPLCSAQIAELSARPLEIQEELFHTGYGAGSGVLYETAEISLFVIESENVERFTTNEDSISQRLLNIGRDHYLFALPSQENTTACHGDSGGPLYSKQNNQMNVHAVNGAVLGHSTLGASGCNQGYLNMITPITPYYDWIQTQIMAWTL